ncbi:MAG: aldehyde dehydrogenase family protein, partial [Paraglaciecola polaris]
MQHVPLLINGEFISSESQQFIDVTNPANNTVIAKAPVASDAEVDAAVASAKEAFITWREVPVSERARVMMRYQQLLKEHHDEIATILSSETGKTLADAKGDVWRGIE